MFIPNTDQFPYPEDTSGHFGTFKMNRGIVFDKDYPYVDKSTGFAFKRFWVRLLMRLIVFPMAKIKMGIRIKGKENLRRYKDLLSRGAISVSNHIHPWDYICIMKAIHNLKWPYLLSLDKNINDDSGPLVRLVGGIPIPVNDKEATIAFSSAINNLLKEGNVVQIYAEGSLWNYYSPIRPFKRGAASIAIKNNKPILPMAFSFRKPGWIRHKIFKQIALFDLNIGKPLLANPNLSLTAQIDDLTSRTHQAVCSLAGFKDNNIYPPIYNKNVKRKDF